MSPADNVIKAVDSPVDIQSTPALATNLSQSTAKSELP